MKKNGLLSVALLTLLSGCNVKTSDDGSLTLSSNESSTGENSSISSENPLSKKRVVLLGIDGAGHQFNEQNTPKIMEIFKNYATSNEVLSANPTISAQSWGSMLTGVIPTLHQFTNDSIAQRKNQISDVYPTIFKQIYLQDEEAQLASFVNWNPINHGIVEDQIGVFKYTSSSDDEIAENIIAYLEDFDPTFVFAQFDSVDHAGHVNGFTSKEYYDALKVLDNRVQAIYQKIVSLGWEEDTLFIVTTDHGGKGFSHGGFSNDEKYNFFGARNQNVNHLAIENMMIRDIPAIIAHHLNVQPSSSMDSLVPKGLFKDQTTNDSRQIIFNHAVNTPNLEDKKGILNYFKKEDLHLLLSFDGHCNDVINDYQVTSRNNQFVDGVVGKAIEVSNLNYLTIKDLLFENKSFTIATFVNYDAVSGDPCLFSNKNWASGLNDGLVFSLRNEDMKFNIGANMNARSDVTLHYPSANHIHQWQHLAISYDARSCQLSFYVNFSLEFTCQLERGRNFDSSYPFNIGQDGTGVFNAYPLHLLIDDFMVFNISFKQEECLKLKDYYLQLLK